MSQPKPEEAVGWGRRVGGCRPYLSWEFRHQREQIELTEKYHRPIKCVLLTHREFCRLKRAAGEAR